MTAAGVGAVDQVVDELDHGLDHVVVRWIGLVGVGWGETGPDSRILDVVALAHNSDRMRGVTNRRP